MTRAAPLPRRLGTAFSVGQARALNVSVSRLRARDLEQPFHGARTQGPVAGVAEHASALTTLLTPDQYLSHTTSAELHGLRLPEGYRPSVLHVSGFRSARGMRRPGVRGHRTTFATTVTRTPTGVPVSSPVEAWCECAELLGIDDLVVMGDGLVCRKGPLATIAELEHAVRRRVGRRGAARLRAALPLIRAGTDSARETMLRLLVVRAGFAEPRVNLPLRDNRDRVVGHGDLVWERERIVLEYEGRQHAEDAWQFGIDIRRLDDIVASGYRVIRVDKHLMTARADLVRRITEAFAAAEETRNAL